MGGGVVNAGGADAVTEAVTPRDLMHHVQLGSVACGAFEGHRPQGRYIRIDARFPLLIAPRQFASPRRAGRHVRRRTDKLGAKAGQS